MESKQSNAPETAQEDKRKAVKQYFWDNKLDEVTKNLAEGRIPDGLDRDMLLKEFASYVRTYVPPHTDKSPVSDIMGERICGARTGYFAERLESFVNNTIADLDGFCDYVRVKWHRSLQHTLMLLIVKLIRMFANMDEREIDARNRYAVTVAQHLSRTLDEM